MLGRHALGPRRVNHILKGLVSAHLNVEDRQRWLDCLRLILEASAQTDASRRPRLRATLEQGVLLLHILSGTQCFDVGAILGRFLFLTCRLGQEALHVTD